MTWAALLAGGGGFAVICTGLVTAILRLGRVLQKLDDVSTEVNEVKSQYDALSSRLTTHLTNHLAPRRTGW